MYISISKTQVLIICILPHDLQSYFMTMTLLRFAYSPFFNSQICYYIGKQVHHITYLLIRQLTRSVLKTLVIQYFYTNVKCNSLMFKTIDI